MSTLKQFYRNALQNQHTLAPGICESRTHSLELESHLATAVYNGFTLTEAVRPSLSLSIIPQQGFMYEGRFSQRVKHPLSILVASVSRERIFDTFLELLNPLGSIVNVVLETSHGLNGIRCAGLHREHIDLPVLKSFLYDYEDLLLNDGCTGITVCAIKSSACVRLDEHKLILVRAKTYSPFEKILYGNGVDQNEAMQILTDAEHIHITRDEYVQRFKRLRLALGMDGNFSAAR